ncbi:MAG: glutamate formimidoyltransferase [Armatimonadetes bacterium]|nr:glutamate formimidoyltransferase [Armatimonadota bacterium]
MPKLVQCVPNFSEGRRRDVIGAIVDAIKAASGVKVIDYSADFDHNRCVVTFLGSPEEVRVSMLAGARKAVELIDMNKHEGVHPRIGAVDVVPVVPVCGVTMEEVVELGHAIGRDIAQELGIPVYFYENCALREQCENLANVRKGGFEGLKKSGLVGNRAPDLGPNEIHPTAGAVVVGARGPLIAYNINLATGDISIARSIASKIRRLRESGEAMAGVKAIGLYLASRGIAQVSFNITRPDLTGLWEVYSFVEREAREMGVDILESELVGVLREEQVIDAFCAAMKFKEFSRDRVLENRIIS